MIQTALAALLLITLSFLGFGIGALFFNRVQTKTRCGQPPKELKLKSEPCPSQQAGICPIEDDTGALKLLRHNKLT